MPKGGAAFTLLTTDPSPDVAHWSAWLEQPGNEADLLRVLAAGLLRVELSPSMVRRRLAPPADPPQFA